MLKQLSFGNDFLKINVTRGQTPLFRKSFDVVTQACDAAGLSKGARSALSALLGLSSRYLPGLVVGRQSDLAPRIGVSLRALNAYLAELEGAGLIECHPGGFAVPLICTPEHWRAADFRHAQGIIQAILATAKKCSALFAHFFVIAMEAAGKAKGLQNQVLRKWADQGRAALRGFSAYLQKKTKYIQTMEALAQLVDKIGYGKAKSKPSAEVRGGWPSRPANALAPVPRPAGWGAALAAKAKTQQELFEQALSEQPEGKAGFFARWGRR